MATTFKELTKAAQAGKRVATDKEREDLYCQNRFVEDSQKILNTLENRRSGIQALTMELLRRYQEAHKIASLIYTKERREEFDKIMENIINMEEEYDERFVQPCPDLESQMCSSRKPCTLTPCPEQSRLHNFLKRNQK